jgi:hypothetical protein
VGVVFTYSIPVEITQLTSLERLDLSNNDLLGLPNEMGHMPQLKSLHLDGNPLKTMRRDILQVFMGITGLLCVSKSFLSPGSLSLRP